MTLFAPYFAGAQREYLLAAGLDRYGRLVAFAEQAGDVTSVSHAIAPVRIVMGHAATRAVVIAHNHVIGDAAPSHDDRRATVLIERFVRVGNARLHDHIIVAPASHFSFAENGLL